MYFQLINKNKYRQDLYFLFTLSKNKRSYSFDWNNAGAKKQ